MGFEPMSWRLELPILGHLTNLPFAFTNIFINLNYPNFFYVFLNRLTKLTKFYVSSVFLIH